MVAVVDIQTAFPISDLAELVVCAIYEPNNILRKQIDEILSPSDAVTEVHLCNKA